MAGVAEPHHRRYWRDAVFWFIRSPTAAAARGAPVTLARGIEAAADLKRLIDQAIRHPDVAPDLDEMRRLVAVVEMALHDVRRGG